MGDDAARPLLGIEPVRAQAVTAEKLAINAVMAGCLPMHFPVVLTAFTAMLDPKFLLHGATASTGGCAIFVVLNGPIRHELGASGSFNALGNSDRATAVIGRALRLALINILECGRAESTAPRWAIRANSPTASPRMRRLALAAARRTAGDAAGGLGRDGHGGRRAAADHERMDHPAARKSSKLSPPRCGPICAITRCTPATTR